MLGQTGLAVSCVGIGALPIGPGQLNLPLEEGSAVICDALRRGISFIDTAQYYRTYPYIRHALEVMGFVTEENICGAGALSAGKNPHDAGALSSKKNLHDADLPVISSKSLASSYDDMMAAIEECRDALGLKTIDIFLMHEVRSGQFAARAGAWQALQDARRAGLVRAIGISTHHVDVARAMADVSACDVVFALLNYRGMGIRCGQEAGTKEAMVAALTVCKAAGKGI